MLDIDRELFKMEEIPVTFEWDGKIVKGTLDWCPGAGGYHWDLHVNRYYWGMQLLYYSKEDPDGLEWRFYNQANNKMHLAEYFGQVLISWYQ